LFSKVLVIFASLVSSGGRNVECLKLIDALNADDALNKNIGELARLLRVLSGMYDQAARAAASL
jgi:predicted MarR family transcription regulator